MRDGRRKANRQNLPRMRAIPHPGKDDKPIIWVPRPSVEPADPSPTGFPPRTAGAAARQTRGRRWSRDGRAPRRSPNPPPPAPARSREAPCRPSEPARQAHPLRAPTPIRRPGSAAGGPRSQAARDQVHGNGVPAMKKHVFTTGQVGQDLPRRSPHGEQVVRHRQAQGIPHPRQPGPPHPAREPDPLHEGQPHPAGIAGGERAGTRSWWSVPSRCSSSGSRSCSARTTTTSSRWPTPASRPGPRPRRSIPTPS